MRREFLAIAAGDVPAVRASFRAAFDSGFLESIFPGFNALDGCTQGKKYHREGDVLVHTGEVFAHAAQMRHLSPGNYDVLLVVAAIHDFKKPATRFEDAEGKVSFLGHDVKGAEVAPELCSRAGLNPDQSAVATWLVLEHMAVHDLPEMRPHARMQYYRDERFPLLAAIQEADARGNWADPEGKSHAPVHAEFFASDREKLVADALRAEAENSLKKRVVSILQAKGEQPGPRYGAVQRAIVAQMASADFSDDTRLAEAVEAALAAA